VGPRPGLDDERNLSPTGLEIRLLGRPARSQSVIPTALPRLSYVFNYSTYFSSIEAEFFLWLRR
jgi:hypothetical protein